MWPSEGNRSADRKPTNIIFGFGCAIRNAQKNRNGPTISANIGKPEVSGSNTSTITKAGIVITAKIMLPASASGTACPIVATRAVATAARITAVGPCGQAVRIQNQPTRTTAKAARNPVHSAAIGSLAGLNGMRPGTGALPERQVSYASA